MTTVSFVSKDGDNKSMEHYTMLSKYHRLAGPEGTWFEIPMSKWKEFKAACKNLQARDVIKKFERFQVH